MKTNVARSVLPLALALYVTGCSPEGGADDVPDVEIPADETSAAIDVGFITPVVFVPADATLDDWEVDTVRWGLGEMRGFYARVVGEELMMEDVRVVYGTRTVASYRNGDDYLWGGVDEVAQQLGVGPWDGGRILMMIGVGAGSIALGTGDETTGRCILGIESLTRNWACQNEPWCSQTVWIGTAAHELGHALGNPVNSVYPSIMGDHWYYPERTFIDTPEFPELTVLRRSPFLQAAPPPM